MDRPEQLRHRLRLLRQEPEGVRRERGNGIWGPDGTDYGDRAVPPHEEVTWTRADVCAGRDPDLERALSLARGR